MAAATNTMATPSSLELMLKQIQQMEDSPKDVPPALPTRPVARARLPRSRRRLPFNSEKGDQDSSSSFEESMYESKRANCGDFVESHNQMESTERVGVGSSPLIVESINGSIEKCDCRKNGNDTAEKVKSANTLFIWSSLFELYLLLLSKLLILVACIWESWLFDCPFGGYIIGMEGNRLELLILD